MIRYRYGTASAETIFGTTDEDRIFAGEGNDKIVATSESTFGDILRGEGGNDTIYAGSGNDTLYGGTGADVLVGSKGKDVLYGGGQADTFSFSQGDSLVGKADMVMDFQQGLDKINVRGMKGWDQDFAFLGQVKPTQVDHDTLQVRYRAEADRSVIEVYQPGDLQVDAEIAVLGTTRWLTWTDFIA